MRGLSAKTVEDVLAESPPHPNLRYAQIRPLPASGARSTSIPVNRECPMEYAPGDLKPRERYKVLTSFVLPRPIAWVTTVGPTGVVNAAPYSFFNVFCEDPPLCMFAANLEEAEGRGVGHAGRPD